ncbi:MAG TPA: hypothetical protein VJT31_07245 [Rugosimonospora sp.]|nr:hypothetical protein [Rugosimonospora sp.]
MEELVKLLASVRENDALSRAVAELFDKRPGTPEFKRPGATEFTMSASPGMMEYTME